MENWIEELEKLGNLRDLGILTEAEFQAGKKKLLAMRKQSSSNTPSNVDPDSRTVSVKIKPDLEKDQQEQKGYQSSSRGPALQRQEGQPTKRKNNNKKIPDQIGSYRIISILGKGGMGAVYKARHMEESWARRQGGDVAIKVMLPKYSEDAAFRDRFMREASLGQEVQHENVAKVHEVIVDAGSIGLVMEYVSGETLQDLIPEEGMPIPEAVKILMPVAEALDHIHKKGIVHRDLKPENIKVTPEGRPVILDFGIAKSDDGDMSMTKTGVMMGTVSYMAPEQIDAKNVGPEADRYAFGIMVYELLTGQKPWEKDLSEGRIYTLKLQGNLVPAHFVHEEITEALSKSVMRMMSLRPQHRHQSCSLFIRSVANGGADLERIEEDTLSKEDFERVRQHYGNLVAAVEELEVQSQAQNRRLQQYTRERDATLTSLENRYNKEREMAENIFQKVQDQIDQAITDVHDEFKKRRTVREDEIPVMRKDIKAVKMQIKELEGKLDSGWNSFINMFNSANKKEIEEDIQRLKRKISNKSEELEMSQKNLPNDLTALQIEEEKAVDNFNRAGEARINSARIQMQRKINASKKILHENQDKVQSRFNEEKKVIDAAIIDLKRELETKSDQIKALKEAYPDDVWVIKSKKILGSVEFELVQVPSGKFWMGARGDDDNHLQDERPRHQVELTKSYWMTTTLITQSLYEEVRGDNPSKFRGAKKPVENVSWLDAIRFCNEFSKRQNLTPCYTIVGDGDVKWNQKMNGYRLPTEAEWEYAAQAGKEYIFSGGDKIGEVAWYSGNTSFETKAVAKRRANSYGLFDMSGNLWEWCWDRYAKYPSVMVADPAGSEDGTRRVRRGGSWRNKANHIRITNRAFSDPSSLSSAYGFRVVRTLFEKK